MLRALIPAAAAACLVLVATAGAASTLRLQADASGRLRFSTSTLRTSAGRVTIVMRNPSAVPHNIAVRGNGLRRLGRIVTGGERSRITVTLRRGTYTFFCSVPGHEPVGMRGRLIVR